MSSSFKFLLVAGMSTSFTHCSGKHSRNNSSSSISRIFAQELCFQVPLLFLQLGSALLGKVVGVIHEPRTGTVVFGVGCALSGAGSLSSSTLVPCCLSSAISSASPPRIFGATSCTDKGSPAVTTVTGPVACGSIGALTTTSSSNGVAPTVSTLKFFQVMWQMTPSSISGILHPYQS